MSSVKAYEASLQPYRQQFLDMLGWLLNNLHTYKMPAVRKEFFATDELGSITRMWIEVLPDLELYGLLFLPSNSHPVPLVIS